MTYRFRQLNLNTTNNYIKHTQDLCDVKRLHNEVFPNTNASFDWFDWYLNLATYSGTSLPTRIYGAYHGDQLVGMWCVEPKRLNNVTKTVTVGRAFATGIHQDHRRNGLFTELSKFAIASEKELGQYSWIFGFPQVGRSVIGGHIKAGWQHIKTIDARGYVPTKECAVVPLTTVRVNAWDTVGDSARYPFSFDETPEYKRMRWHRHPEHHYITLMKGSGTLTLKTYGPMWHIADLQGDRGEVCDMLKAAQALAYRHRASELSIWCADNEYHYGQIVHVCGFEKLAVGTLSVELLAVPITAKAEETPQALSHPLCHFQMGVEEAY